MSEIFARLDQQFEHILIHSGQHVDSNLSDVFFRGLKIRQPDFNLGIGGAGRYHYHQLADISVKIVELFERERLKPDVVMFLGDSNSVLASIVLKKEGYRIAHIEAGMRSYDGRMLEENNRVVCDHMSDLLFVYHDNYRRNLLKENIPAEKIHVVGNTIVEVARRWMPEVGPRASEHILVDIHRPENFRDRMRMQAIVGYVEELARGTDKPVLWLNFPRTMAVMKENGVELPASFNISPLMGYIEFLTAQRHSFCIVSDSGTAQEEAAVLDVPVLVPRDFTERWESVEAGNSAMVDLRRSRDELVEQALLFVRNFRVPADTSWMGPGDTADRIITVLAEKI
jgi:UDP-N-acetylglucosamine 2-epimerase (non-hydrolysing)